VKSKHTLAVTARVMSAGVIPFESIINGFELQQRKPTDT
jgi:hypothetical protein